MRGPETPTMLLKASDRVSRSRIWSAVHPAEVLAGGAEVDRTQPNQPPKRFSPIKLGQRGTPVAAPRRARR